MHLQTIKRSRLQNGDLLSLHINRVQVQACHGAFAAILGDGSVVTWGSAAYGGDSSAARDQLKNMQQIQASHDAFAAILGNGQVVTCRWYGGVSSAARDQLKNVQQIPASHILGNGQVVTCRWYGGVSSAVQEQLKNVHQIQACATKAVAAILGDGSDVT